MSEQENKKDDYIKQLWDTGYDLQRALKIDATQMKTKKIELLNYISACKADKYIEEISKLYITASIAIPDILQIILQSEEADKKDFMYAFLFGLCGDKKKEKKINEKELFTIKEASEILEVHYETARGYIDEGKLETEEVGKKKLIKKESLLKLLEIKKSKN